MTVRDDKRALRARVLARRTALGAERRAALSADITGHLLALPALTNAHTVAAYLTFGEEFDTSAFVQHVLRAGRRLVLPRIVDADSPTARHLVLYAIGDVSSDTVPGRWGIREPDSARCPAIGASEVDLALIPGVSFDRCGGRLGHGAGYYDRLLTGLRPDCVRVAAAFSAQIVDGVPVEPHDQAIGWLVTEGGAQRAVPRDPSQIADY